MEDINPRLESFAEHTKIDKYSDFAEAIDAEISSDYSDML